MSLAARRSTRLREDFVIRLGCLLVSVAVLASLILEPPRAKAFALTSSAVTALAGGFLNACGLAPVVSGMSSSGEVNESLARLIQDFLDEEHPGIKDAVDWIGDVVLTVNGGRVIIPSETAKRLSAFAAWVAGKYGTKAGVNQVYHVADSHVMLQDGRILYFSEMGYLGSLLTVTAVGSVFNSGTDFPLVFSTGYYYGFDSAHGKYATAFFTPENEFIAGSFFSEPMDFTFSLRNDRYLFFFFRNAKDVFESAGYVDLDRFLIGDVISVDESLSLDVADTLTIPGELADSQSLALDVGATDTMSIQEIFQGILDAILAGDLAASAEIVDEAVEPVDPDPPVVPVVPSGLDELGAALTSRFPFSIPWDVYKGVTLLAAPPKAPYFEVDFMAPIADRVGGWQGSTKIVLDFSEYEIIGQVCRWTSTIGFCLMLASGTKRLIWTA